MLFFYLFHPFYILKFTARSEVVTWDLDFVEKLRPIISGLCISAERLKPCCSHWDLDLLNCLCCQNCTEIKPASCAFHFGENSSWGRGEWRPLSGGGGGGRCSFPEGCLWSAKTSPISLLVAESHVWKWAGKMRVSNEGVVLDRTAVLFILCFWRSTWYTVLGS